MRVWRGSQVGSGCEEDEVAEVEGLGLGMGGGEKERGARRRMLVFVGAGEIRIYSGDQP